MPRKGWAGNRDRQMQIVNLIMGRFSGEDIIDVMGALQTCIANIICDHAKSRGDAMDGMNECVSDMMNSVINERFPATTKTKGDGK